MSETTIRVISPGLLTTVQDLGRNGQARFGVAPGGALDRAALILGNRLLSNAPGEAALEITLVGPALRFEGAVNVAITGADLGATVDGRPVPLWTPIAVHAGSDLRFDPEPAALGARAYLCVAGGIDIEPVLGSRSTDLLGRFGGWRGRPLVADDSLPVGEPVLPPEVVLRRRLVAPPPRMPRDPVARVVRGPQWDRFTAAGQTTFLGSEYAVSPQSNRQGIRLSGPPIEHTLGADVVSEGITLGGVQVPGDGLPIVLLAARQTVGGYTKIATVAGADLDLLGQLRPTDSLRFAEVSIAEARAAFLAYRAGLGPDAVTEEPRQFGGGGASLDSLSEEIDRVSGAWDPDSVVSVIAALKASSVTEFAIEDARAGFRLEIRLGGYGENALRSTESSDGQASVSVSDHVVTAPVLGVFYRRGAPDQPPLVEEGQRVESGQTIGVLEVMKIYHEVASTAAGVLAEFLIEEGQFVEYGQAIARITQD